MSKEAAVRKSKVVQPVEELVEARSALRKSVLSIMERVDYDKPRAISMLYSRLMGGVKAPAQTRAAVLVGIETLVGECVRATRPWQPPDNWQGGLPPDPGASAGLPAVAKRVLDTFRLSDGTLLRDATRKLLLKDVDRRKVHAKGEFRVAHFLEKIAERLPDDQTCVGAVWHEKEVAKLRRQAEGKRVKISV